MLIKKAERFDVECVARGYIVGSGWKDYQATGAICGNVLPEGLQLCEILDTYFTPAAKNDEGTMKTFLLKKCSNLLASQMQVH